MSNNISLKYKTEIKQRLDEMGVFDQDGMIDLIERWRFSEFVGKFAMGLAYHTFMSLTEEQIKNNTYEIEKISESVNGYANGIGGKFYNKVIQYHKDGNYAQATVSSPLMLWFASLDANGLIELGDYLLDIYVTPYYTEEDKEFIISSAQKNTGNTLGNLSKKIKDVSVLADIFKDELSEQVESLELLRQMQTLFDENGVSREGATNIFNRRYSALSKAVLDISDDVSVSTFVTSKTDVTDGLDFLVEFLSDFLDEENVLWLSKKNVLDSFNTKLSDLYDEATVNSENLYNHIKGIMANDALHAPEFALRGWQNILEKLRTKSSPIDHPISKIGILQSLVCSGSVGGEIADEMSSLFQECFIEALPEVNDMERVSKGAVKQVIIGVAKIMKMKGL